MREMKDSGVPWIGEIPKDWTCNTIKSVCQVIRGGSPRPIEQYLSDSGYNWIKIGDTRKGYKYIDSTKQKIIAEGLNKTRIVHSGDLLLTNSMSYGEPYILRIDGCIHDGWVALMNIHDAYKEFIYYALISDACKVQFSLQVAGGVVQNLNVDKIGVTIIPRPNINEQQRIADFLDAKCTEIDAILEKTKESIEEYKKLKQSVITEAVTKGIRGERPMKDSGVEWIGEIPAEWKVLPLKNCFTFGKGLSITKDNLVEEGCPVINYGQIHSKKNTGVSIEDSLFRFVKDSDTTQTAIVYPNDFLFADTSEDLDGCGNCVYNDTQNAFYGGYHSIILHSQLAESNKYLAYLFKTDPWRSQIRSSLTEVKVYSVSQKVLKKTSILIPPIIEQQEIAAYLDEKCAAIDALIASKESLITELESYKKSLIYEYVTGKKEVPAV